MNSRSNNTMIIEIGNFRLTSSENRFNLSEIRTVQQKDFNTKLKTGETYQKEIEVGYDMSFEACIRYILDRTVNDQGLTVDLRTYLEMYKKEREKITNLLK